MIDGPYGARGKRLPRCVGILARDLAAPLELVKRRQTFRPQECRRREILLSEDREPCARQEGRDGNTRVDDESQRPAREREIARTTSGIGAPKRVLRQADGRARDAAADSVVSRSDSSITCCVPTLRALSLPERIQRRIVSGSRPARRAASGTVSTVARYYNTLQELWVAVARILVALVPALLLLPKTGGPEAEAAAEDPAQRRAA